MTAGRLDKRVRFERRSAKSGAAGEGSDRFGRSGGGWIPAFLGADNAPSADASTRWTGASYRTGGETLAIRLEGRQPVELLIRRDPATVKLSLEERAVILAEDLTDAFYLNLKAVAPFPPDPEGFLLLTCEAGGANG